MRRLPLLVALAAGCLLCFAAISRTASHEKPPVVTAVEGISNFHRLGVSYESSAMGRTGVWGPTPEAYTGPPTDFVYTPVMAGKVVLNGADIYRLSCAGCHKVDGNGTPPEIPPIMGPVQAMSAPLMERRMAERGRPITAAFARELTSGSKKDLLDRLKNGGQKMPAFSYLTASEIDALISYLNVLAAVPGAGKLPSVNEPPARTGELLVKGTCHICHDAAGTWPDPEELLDGAIPPIAGFTSKKTLSDFIWKVRHGAPIAMGPMAFPYRGRMPVFDYLTDDDVGKAYLYLMIDPPRNDGGLRRPQG